MKRRASRPDPKTFYVYILANKARVLYAGITNDLARRMYEHKHELISGFTKRYGIHRLVYFEEHDGAASAIARESQVKGWLRARKVALIESADPEWNDLSADWPETP
jgi:putative endonuclease